MRILALVVLPAAVLATGGIDPRGDVLLTSRKLGATSQQPMKVIGAGLGRTGTSSFKKALEMLGYNPYHMVEGVMQLGQVYPWAEWTDAWRSGDKEALAAATKRVIALLRDSGFNATTDYPACLVWKDLLDEYPDAKVVLSVRPGDNPGASWAKSASETIFKTAGIFVRPPFSLMPFFQAFVRMCPVLWEATGIAPRGTLKPEATPTLEDMARGYESWVMSVGLAAPPDRLLVHSYKDGFPPLCDFLGVPPVDCPDTYPNVNDKEEFLFMMRTTTLVADAFFPVIAALAVAAVYFLWCVCGKGADRAKTKRSDGAATVGGKAGSSSATPAGSSVPRRQTRSATRKVD